MKNIGFIGTGIMGAPMAGHLANAGYLVTVCDVNAAAAQAVATAHPGVRVAATPREVGARADIVITMLPSGPYVREVVMGPDGLLDSLRLGSLVLDTSSSEPWITKETAATLAARGIAMVDAPVSGAQWGAIAADLVFMVGGAKEEVARVEPLLRVMGKQVFHLGPLGAGHTMKCINNLITATTFIATAEGLAIGAKYGLDADVMTEVLNVSTGQSWLTQNHIQQRVTSRKFDDPFKLELMTKDVGIAMELAERAWKGALPLPLNGLAQQLYKAANRAAGAGASVSEMARWVESQAGVEICGHTSPAKKA